MSKKKKPAYGVAEIVEGEILPTIVIDWSDCLGDTPLEEWTHGPVRHVTSEEPPVAKKEPKATRRKKKRP